jgi:hypothetical protein
MTGFVPSITAAPQYYAELGFDTLPLPPGSKQAGVRAWQNRSPLEMWQSAHKEANIAIRCGGHANLAVIDCDDKNQQGTFYNVQSFMAGLGYTPGDYPVVKTKSGNGRHIYISLADPIQGNYKHLSPELGAGEFRFGSGAYVVAPPSILEKPYQLIYGDFRQLPELEMVDIAALIHDPYFKTKPKLQISRNARKMLNGEGIERFDNDRSRFDQGLITSLVNKDFEFENILPLFKNNVTSGKFMELFDKSPNRAIGYLQHSYRTAVRWGKANISPGRKYAQKAILWANSNSWPGRTGAYDWAVYLAHSNIVWRSGKVEYAASGRELAEIANISNTAASNANHRLIKLGFITQTKSYIANYSNRYKLENIFENSTSIPHHHIENYVSHDVFHYFALGKSCEQIWCQLQNNSLSIEELIIKTGRTKITIKKWLDYMANKIIDIRTGEIVSMVCEKDGVWRIKKGVNLDYIAELLNVKGIGDARKQKHQQQRKKHKNDLQR